MKPGVLFVIATLFSLAFVTRAIGTVESVREEASGRAVAQAHAEPQPMKDEAAADYEPRVGDHVGEDIDADVVSLAAMIRQRTREIERRIEELNERERVLNGVEARVDEKLAELEVAQAALADTAARVDAASDRDIKALASMYANMKPQQAGAIFNAMEPSFAAGFLTAMRAESAAAVLASMEPQKAYAVSVIIAGRNLEN
ncbi:MAG: hypothetical protein AAFX08_03555 [Pseudomonadota bacterium]